MENQTKNLVLKLKIAVDDTEGKKVVILIKEQVQSLAAITAETKKLKEAEADRLKQLAAVNKQIKEQINEQKAAQKTALGELNKKVTEANAKLELQVKGWQLIPTNIQAAINKYNKLQEALDKEVATKLRLLNIEKESLSAVAEAARQAASKAEFIKKAEAQAVKQKDVDYTLVEKALKESFNRRKQVQDSYNALISELEAAAFTKKLADHKAYQALYDYTEKEAYKASLKNAKESISAMAEAAKQARAESLQNSKAKADLEKAGKVYADEYTAAVAKRVTSEQKITNELRLQNALMNKAVTESITLNTLEDLRRSREAAGYSNYKLHLENLLQASKKITTELEVQTQLEAARSNGYNFVRSNSTTNAVDSRPYTPNAYGTVAESRAKKAKEVADLARKEIQKELAEQTEAAKQLYQIRMGAFKASITEQDALMRHSVALQTAVQIHGINSVQAERVRAAEATRQLERTRQATVSDVHAKVSTGGISTTEGMSRIAVANREYASGVLATTQRVHELERALANTTERHRNLFARVGEVIGAYQIWNTVLSYTKQALLAIPKAGIELDSTKAALFGIFGSEQGAKNMQFLSELADHAGQSLLGLEQAYRRYAPSAILAGASQEAINKSFKDFAEVGTILHLPEDKLNSLFLALDQMFAKGVVQSEEIKKQLGNVLPGAVEVGAKAMGKTPAVFMDMMSKNLVTAKEFIPKFAKVYRDTFGGIDDSVFESIRVKLLSNLQRVKNEYLRINREIYNSTQEMMNSIVKSVAGALTTVRENLTGIGQAIEIFAALMVARLGIAIVSSLGSIGLLVTKLGSLVPILTGLSLPVTALVLGFLEMYRSLNDLSINYDKATGFTVQCKDQQVSLTNYIRAFAIIAIEDLTLAYQKFSNLFSDSNFVTGILGALDFVSSKLHFLKEGLFSVMAATAAMAKKASGSVESISDLYQTGLKDLAGSLEKAPVIKLAAELDFKGRPKPEAVIPPMGAGKTIEDATGDVSSKAAAAARKALTNLYKDIERDLKLIAEQTKTSLADLDESYAKNLVSISTYYSSKAKLQYSEIDRQKAVYEREIAVARKSGDIAKIEEIKDKIAVLSEQAKQIPSILGKEQFKSLETYNKGLKETNADYKELIGNIRNAAKIRFDITETPKIAAYKAVVGDTTSSAATKQAAETALQQEKSIRANAGILTEINALNTERNELETVYNQKIQVVNVQMRAGVLSQISGMFELKILRDKEIKDLEEKVRLEEEVVRNARLVDPKFELSAKVQKEVELAKSSLESLKAEGDIVGNFFKTMVGDSFQSAFEGLISGSMSASQAFSSFAQSVLSDMQKIIASEIRSQIIGAVFKGLGTVFGAAIGGMGAGVSGNGTNVSSASNFVGPMKPSVFSANGNVFSGAGISAHSGTIVSSPTVFPFAKGTGLMGEAGPEAILPLQRNSQGKLGVVVSNQNQTSAKSSGIVIQNFSVVVQEKEGTTSEEQAKLIGESVKKQLKVFVQQELINSTRSGGTLNPTSMAASF